uniref:putative pentatricopeptide repeat-containing protein At1g12700, mitochondrial n=1 Tax=Erigeron canadensis TaxID=72917 RepID=UPI001CB91698|nr:putative pentatricopeptide repeat-containing protein At1g12700, mitochondrial [Erigeron canadensis]
MANLQQLLIKRRFKGKLTTNCFLVPLSSFLHLGRRFGTHPNNKSLYSSSCSLDDNNVGTSSSVVVTYDDYDKVTNLNDALKSFNVMIKKRPLPSVVKFTRLLHDVTELKHYACSLYLFKQLCALGVPVNTYTAGIAIKCYHRLYRTIYGLAVLGSCFKQGVELHVSTYNTLLRGFILNNTHLAEHLFCGFISSNRLRELDLSSYKIIVKGLCKVGSNFKAIGLLRLLDHHDGGCRFDVALYNTILNGLCNDIIFIDYAFTILKEMVEYRAIQPNVHTYNSLIYNLCKLNRWDEVCRMLKQMEDAKISPKVKTFNIIVDALCKQDKIAEAQAVIDIMVDHDTEYPPNIGTYNPLIEAYCWNNGVSEARKIYDSLDSKGIKPNFVTTHMFYLRYFIDQEDLEFGEFHYEHAPQQSSGLFNWFMYCIANRSCALSEITFPHRKLYCNILKSLKYDHALAFFHMMDRGGLNSVGYVHKMLIDSAIKHRRSDDERRHYHHLFVTNLCLHIDFDDWSGGLDQNGLFYIDRTSYD